MIYAFWGTLAGVAVLLIAAAHQSIPTFGAREPAGKHHRPRAPREWPWGERVAFRANARIARRQAERDSDEKYLRKLQEIHAGQHMDTMPPGEAAERAMWGEHYGQPGEPGWEGTADAYAADMAAGPLMPLPPEVVDANEPAGWALYGDVKAPLYAVQPDGGVIHFVHRPDEPEPDDPLAVLGDDACADALVGPVQPEPEYPHLREGQYAEAGAVGTGFFAAALLDKYEAQQLLASYAERAEGGGR